MELFIEEDDKIARTDAPLTLILLIAIICFLKVLDLNISYLSYREMKIIPG